MSEIWDDTRADWGAAAPTATVVVAPSDRTEFFSHYDGGDPLNLPDHADCLARVKADQRFHMSIRGWYDIGYNGLVCQHGRAIEGRGLAYSGAHCPDHNRSGFGMQFMVGGEQLPTAAAYARMRRLYDACVTYAGHALAKRGHRDGYATLCPGEAIYAWVQAGMPYPNGYKPPGSAPASALLKVDGALGPATIRRWQEVNGTPVDGVISVPSGLVKAVQRFLNTQGAGLTVDGKGIGPNTSQDYGPTQTVKALQHYYGTPVDGILSHPESACVKALQRALNNQR